MSAPNILPLTAAEAGRKSGWIAERMASVIYCRLLGFGSCTIDDLSRDGFTATEIAVFEHSARLEAEQRFGTRRYAEALSRQARQGKRVAA